MGWTEEQKDSMKKWWRAEGVERGVWFEIEHQADADFLLEKFMHLHDAYLVHIDYNNAIYDREDSHITLCFDSCWIEPILELRFSGLERLNLSGQKFEPFYDCFISVKEGPKNSILGKSIVENRIIFIENSELSITETLNDIANTSIFVVANRLKWRFMDSKDAIYLGEEKKLGKKKSWKNE
ncbi:MAG: hypothetical protein FWB72_01190 [Firmicutes bacterium]|nr:hypothetical protein [Bacillota bacterium]